MGQVIDGKCSCGWWVKRLSVGARMSGNHFSIFACYDCGAVKNTKDKDSAESYCGDCESQMTRIEFYNDDYYKCPRCNRNELFLQTVMMVD